MSSSNQRFPRSVRDRTTGVGPGGCWVLASVLLLAAGCGNKTTGPGPESAATPDGDKGEAEPAAPPAWKLDEVGNLNRLGKLDARQRELLGKNGFFLAPQPPPAKASSDDDRNTLKRASHLFHVYERNDYIAFPSFVTADLAIDATHSYFDAMMREVEEKHLVPKLDSALAALVREAETVRAAAKGAPARREAARAVAYWGVALHLLRSPARGDAPDKEQMDWSGREDLAPEDRPKPAKARPPVAASYIPKAVRGDVEAVAKAVQAARGPLPVKIVRSKIDLTQMRPRGHYTRTGVLQRYFRAMSWLGMARFAIGDDDKDGGDDVIGLAFLTRSWLGAEKARAGMKDILTVTTFFAGGPDAADLEQLAAQWAKVAPKAGGLRADDLISAATLAGLRGAAAKLPAPRLGDGKEIRVMGKRAFEDTVAMRGLIQPLISAVEKGRTEAVIPRMMGALGAAAMLGSDLARDEISAAAAADVRADIDRAIGRGRDMIDKLPAERWNADAYHGTLNALRSLLGDVPANAPALLRTAAWKRRALQAFASGWAELRHDTILYGEQLGAECDAPEPEPPPSWVEPVPEVYSRLSAMVKEFDRRLKTIGIPGKKSGQEEDYYYRPLPEKAKLVIGFLDFLRQIADKQAAGTALTRDEKMQLTMIGGRVEWLLISLADTDMLARRDQDMAVVADVFSWRPSSKAVEVGVAHPDLIYALIPTPKGPVVARGAVMSYREFLQPMDKRLTDTEWRRMLDADKTPPRPNWLEPIYAEPVPAIKLVGEGVDRCGPMSGAGLDL